MYIFSLRGGSIFSHTEVTMAMGEKVGIDNLYSLFSTLASLKTIPFDCKAGPHDHDQQALTLTLVRNSGLYWCYTCWSSTLLYTVYNGVQWFQFLDESLGETALNLIWLNAVSYFCTLQ
jgi:hypothetical protein